MRPNTTNLLPFACFGCQRSFKRSIGEGELIRTCPACGARAIRLGPHFKAPRAGDDEQWAKVRLLVEHGFLFQHVHDTEARVPYPATLASAREFVQTFRDQARTDSLPEIRDALRGV